MKISDNKAEFNLLGKILIHSLSPLIHKKLFELSGLNYSYGIVEADENELKQASDKLNSGRGYNITIPYKCEIIKYLDKLDETAQRYGAVNCVDCKNGVLTGYNTDVNGFLKSLEVRGIDTGSNVLLLGCGGAGRMMAVETLRHGGKLTIAVREQSIEKTKSLVCELTEKFGGSADVLEYGEINGYFDVMLNSTPIGMFPNIDGCPVGDDVISSCDAVFDAVYNPTETVLLSKAKRAGKIAVGGMAMLVYQAVEAHRIWYGGEFSEKDIAQIINQAERGLADEKR